MKLRFLLIIFLACCALCCISATAITVQPATGVPTGDLAPGTRLAIDTTITEFRAGTGTTFPSTDTLQFYTDLDSPKWSISIVQNGVESPRPLTNSRTVRISGFELEYPSGTSGFDLKVRVSLQGTVPQVTTSADQAILRIRQLDSSDKVRTNGEFIVTRTVINPAEVTANIITAKSDLQAFKTDIDAAKEDGVDTSAIDAKYNAAQTALQSAEAAGSNVGSAQSFLSTARTAITDGRALLADPEVIITEYNGIIYISSVPEGAEVYIANHFRGYTPLNLSNLQTGMTRILLKKPNYHNWEENVFLIPNTIIGIEPNLQRVGSSSGIPATPLPATQPATPPPVTQSSGSVDQAEIDRLIAEQEAMQAQMAALEKELEEQKGILNTIVDFLRLLFGMK